jgi:hypothetical protein
VIAADSRFEQRVRVKLAEPTEARTVTEQPCVEKVRAFAPRLRYELAKAKHVMCQGKLQEFPAKIAHLS